MFELETDLVVLATRERRGLTRMVLGSVARNLLTLAPCSVRIVREGASRVRGRLSPRRQGAGEHDVIGLESPAPSKEPAFIPPPPRALSEEEAEQEIREMDRRARVATSVIHSGFDSRRRSWNQRFRSSYRGCLFASSFVRCADRIPTEYLSMHGRLDERVDRDEATICARYRVRDDKPHGVRGPTKL